MHCLRIACLLGVSSLVLRADAGSTDVPVELSLVKHVPGSRREVSFGARYAW